MASGDRMRAVLCGLAAIGALSAGCATGEAVGFASDFDKTPDRVWIGPEYWANPMEDWRIAGSRLECVSGGENRNVHLLTRALSDKPGLVNASVHVLLEGGQRGAAGLMIGCRDEIDDYRAHALRGNGIKAVITTDGELVLADQRAACKADLRAGVTLRFMSGPAEGGEGNAGGFAMTLTAIGADGKELAKVSRVAPAEWMRGTIAVVNNPPPPHGPAKPDARFTFGLWQVGGTMVAEHDERAWGPILWTMHTVHHTHGADGAVLKMTAQLVPLGGQAEGTAKLEVSTGGVWLPVAESKVDPLACTATFRVAKWDTKKAYNYRVAYRSDGTGPDKLGAIDAEYTGVIRAEPLDKPLVVAAFTGNMDYAFPNVEVHRNVAAVDPDVLFFSGDQIYEQVGGYGIIRKPVDRATLNYLRKWYLLGWVWGDLMRDRPTVCLPDDHDVYQGNIWGEGGAKMREGGSTSSDGGYIEPPQWVNMVHRTQTSHMPDPYDPTPIEQGISVFYGPMLYGRVSFANIADRQFKDGPEKVSTGKGRGDWVEDKDFDTRKLDKPGLQLLGNRQERFLADWAGDWKGADFKCVLSATVFANIADYHGARDNYLKADLDSNGWAQSGRRRALETMRKGYAFHLAGDQHLPTISHYGIDTWGDAGYALCVPSIAVGYPRWWRPDDEGRPFNKRYDEKLPNTGEYKDGFDNFVTVYAVGNPEAKNRPGRVNTAHDKASGFAVVRFDHDKGTITMECYRVRVDVTDAKPGDQFPGWPRTIASIENNGRKPAAVLEAMTAPAGVERPVLEVRKAGGGELVYAVRLVERTVKPWVYASGTYDIRLGDPDTDRWTAIKATVE